MALPAVAALARRGPVVVHGPRWVEALYAHTGAARGPERPERDDVAVLLKPSFSAAWAARGAARRIGVAGDGRRWLLSDVVRPVSAHRFEQYGEIAAVVGAKIEGPPSLPPTGDASAVSTETILLLPCSPSGAPVMWPRFRSLADALGGRAVFAAGPGEDEALAEIAGPHPRLPALSVADLAAVAARAAAVVGNDSGLCHLAAAARRGAGRSAADVIVLFQSTDPARTGPPGCTAIQGSQPDCWPCYRKTCHRGLLCADAPVATVLARLGVGP